MSQEFTPLLSTVDWNEEWKELQEYRRHMDSAEFWDKRSKSFTTKDSPNTYVDGFLELAAIKPDETIFDMGCGTGSLSLPLAEQGHKIVAADFSEGMLAVLQEEIDARGITTIFPKLMSWEDTWEDFGVREGMTDIAIASRSIATQDLKAALLKLTRIARRRVCITLSTEYSPRVDGDVLEYLGINQVLGHDYLYAFAILANEGIKPEVNYIQSARKVTYETREEAWERYCDMIAPALASYDEAAKKEVLKRLEEWLGKHLIVNEDAGKLDYKGLPEADFCIDTPRKVSWAFIAWNI